VFLLFCIVNKNKFSIMIKNKRNRFLVLLLFIGTIVGQAQNRLYADVNEDGEVNIADVNAVIDVILGNSSPISSGIQTYSVNGVSFKMISVEGGTFIMGATTEQGSDAQSDETPVHQVTLSNFWVGETEVTQALWLAVMGENPSRWTGDFARPVERVSWYDCLVFITKLNRMTGMPFRLLTEAEWEFVARGGNKGKGYKYSGSDVIGDIAWYNSNSNGKTHAVATKLPNELGLYDLSGNVWEWCQDWYGSYNNSEQMDPICSEQGYSCVFRGGCYVSSAKECRVSDRCEGYPYARESNIGLRLAL
jgi:formylglycine-generating enzyme required for sulfatase activity